MGCLVELGRIDATPVLRQYAVEGEYWEAALDAVPDWDASELWSGLDTDLLPRRDDSQLAAVACTWEPWLGWARSHPRLQQILDSCVAVRESRPELERLQGLSSTELVNRIRSGDGQNRRRKLLALAGRGDLVLLDLAEDVELRSTRAMRSIRASLRDLGHAAVARARDWTVGGDEDDFAAEGLDDCDESVQEAACSAAPPTPFVIERLRALKAAPERGDRQACAAIRLGKILGQGP